METNEKPRVSLEQYNEMMAKRTPTYAPGTIADWIEKYIFDRSKPGGRQIQYSHACSLKTVRRGNIGPIHHTALKAVDLLDHCKARIASGTKPQTVAHDIGYLGGVLKYAMEIWEIPTAEQAYKAYKKALPQLKREQLIGKSQPRDRLPTDEELAQLRGLFQEQHARNAALPHAGYIDMELVMDAELVTGRRISELCRIERQHVNVEDRTCWIYNLKNAGGKGYHAEFALIEGAWELFERRLAEIPAAPTARLFPFNPKSCGAKYTIAKNTLGIVGLRMHDNRAACFTRLLDRGYSAIQVQKGVSLHKGDGKMLRDHYLRIKAKDLHRGPASELAAQPT